MTRPISDLIVLVTGAGRGLGATIARAFHREGARVTINYRNSRAAAEALATELGPRAAAFCAGVASPEQVRVMVDQITERLGAPDVLVHNALADFAFNGDARTHLDRLSWADIARQTETSVGGALNCLAAMQTHCAAQGFGRIITIGTNLTQNPIGTGDHTRRHGRCGSVLCVALGADCNGPEPDRRWWAGVRIRGHRRVPADRTPESCDRYRPPILFGPIWQSSPASCSS